jgi:uracil phosphoribosyltransferase
MEHATVVGAEALADLQRALGIRIGRLELHIAAGRGHGADTSTFRAMEGVTVIDHVLLGRLLSILRDKDTSHRVFRETMTDAALILGYESMRALRPANIQVQTPLETTTGTKLADEVFVVAILRAGLGLVDGFLRLVPEARVGHLGMYRDEEALRPVGYYENIPSGVESAEVFVVDPMLATGGSGTQAIARLKRAGAQRIHFVCLVAAPEGVKALHEVHPEVHITTAAIDRELDHTGYIRPGLGDAGDRIFGTDR